MKYDLFFVSKYSVNDDAWKDFKNKFPLAQRLENVKSLEQIKKKSFTKFFWVVWNDVSVLDDFIFDYSIPEWDQEYIHVFKNGDYFDGICIFSKNHNVSDKEFRHRFFTSKKEIDVVASKPRQFEQFIIDSYEDYVSACEKSTMDMLWIIPKEVRLLDFKFDLYFSHHNVYERNMNHVFQHRFKNELTYNGVACVPKNKLLSKKEIDYRFPIEKKQYAELASDLKPYDIIFISYNESNADENYEKLKLRFPRAKRLHGIKGIHNAHRAAAELAETNMFFVVDGDAEVVSGFFFDYQVTRYERDIVHIWKSQNPINDLTYGYGGVKLLPRDLVLSMNMDSIDMTMSISSRMKVIDKVSNITRFDTDEFSTWKSAFRECVKLASRPIDVDYDEETDLRIQKWCSEGKERPFGAYAIDGAKAGRDYGYKNIGNERALSKINDFEWLREFYEQRTKDTDLKK
jgi:hypothetical protein